MTKRTGAISCRWVQRLTWFLQLRRVYRALSSRRVELVKAFERLSSELPVPAYKSFCISRLIDS